MKRSIVLGLLCCALPSGVAAAQDLSPLTSFGGGDGWLAPGDRSYLTTDNTQRGIAYNPVTGNLLVVNRAGGLSVNVIDGATGADEGTLNLTGVATSGALFPLNMIGVADDGAIYAANLAVTSSQDFRVYRWANESAAPTLDFLGRPGTNGPRLGDTIDVRGSGAGTQLLFGIAHGSGNKGYMVGSMNGPGGSLAIDSKTFLTTPPNEGDHHHGITFLTGNDVVGTRGGLSGPTQFNPAQVSTFSDDPVAEAWADFTFKTSNERPMDFATVGGVPMLATVATDTSVVRLYDMTDVFEPVLLDALTTTVGPGTANGNGVGQVRWGAIDGNAATLYALNTNNGIQAFQVVVPEPGSAFLVGIAAVAGLSRSRR